MIYWCLRPRCAKLGKPAGRGKRYRHAVRPAVYGSMLGLLGNPNMVYCEYSGVADNMEKPLSVKWPI